MNRHIVKALNNHKAAGKLNFLPAALCCVLLCIHTRHILSNFFFEKKFFNQSITLHHWCFSLILLLLSMLTHIKCYRHNNNGTFYNELNVRTYAKEGETIVDNLENQNPSYNTRYRSDTSR
jgi:hypothetical protein